jgi:hypothetical protein
VMPAFVLMTCQPRAVMMCQPRVVMMFPALCCDASLVLKTLILALMLMMLQPSYCDVIVVDDALAFVL